MQEKTFNQKELERLKKLLKKIDEKGLVFYEEDKDLVLQYVIKGIKKEIEDLSLLNENKSI